MGADDEITVIYHEDRWYVDIVGGGNIHNAIKCGKSFATRTEALEYAADLFYRCPTEGGIRVYNKL